MIWDKISSQKKIVEDRTGAALRRSDELRATRTRGPGHSGDDLGEY